MEIVLPRFEPVTEMMRDEVIEHNMKEADKFINSSYLMYAAAAWLRKHHNRTLRDLQVRFFELGMRARIYPQLHTSADYTLCVPGIHDTTPPLRYVSNFHTSSLYLKKYKFTEEHMSKLDETGNSSSHKYSARAAAENPPSLEQLIAQNELTSMLQWGACTFYADHAIINPDELLERDLKKQKDVKRVPAFPVPAKREIVYIYTNEEGRNVSEYGVLETKSPDGKSTQRMIIHLATYLQSGMDKRPTDE